jgi:hypothetical protein
MKQDLIFSRAANDGFLSRAEILDKAPAAFAPAPAPTTSGRYGHIDTTQAMNILEGLGYGVTQAAQKRPRKSENKMFTEHLLAFAPRDDRFQGEFRAEIVLYNSHNGTSSLKLFAGCYRFICSNGLVAGDGFEAVARHSLTNAETFAGMVGDIAQELPALVDRVEQLKARTMSPAAAWEYGAQAARLRWNDAGKVEDWDTARGAFYDDRTINDMVAARRYDDQGLNAWAVLNRVQENTIRGGASILSITDKAPAGKYRKARPVGSVSDNVKINRALWNQAEQFAGVAA